MNFTPTLRHLSGFVTAGLILGAITTQAGRSKAQTPTPIPSYKITAIPGLPANANVSLLNNKGEISGSLAVYDKSGNYLGNDVFLYSHGVMTLLHLSTVFGKPYPQKTYGYADFINDKGEIAGTVTLYGSALAYKGTTVFLYSHGQVIDVGSLENTGTDSNGAQVKFLQGLGDDGQVIFNANVYDAQHNFVGVSSFYYQNGVVTSLSGHYGTGPNGVSNSSVLSINGLGQAIGNSDQYDSSHHLIVQRNFGYDGISFTDLSTTIPFGALPVAINDRGQITGRFFTSAKGLPGFIYSAGTLIDLPGLSSFGTDSQGGFELGGNALNNSGQILGQASLFDVMHQFAGSTPFLYTHGTMLDLGALGDLKRFGTDVYGRRFTRSLEINNKG